MIVMKHGDTLPTLEDTITFSNAPLPLEECEVFFALQNGGGREIVRRRAEIANAETGQVRFSWRPAELAPGRYRARWVVVFPSGDVLSIPSAGAIEILIEPTGSPA